jgi:hypothetical protein
MMVRLPFENFKPGLRRGAKVNMEDVVVEQFECRDVRHVRFRYRSSMNENPPKQYESNNNNFYMALSYIKVYRLHPEPAFTI